MMELFEWEELVAGRHMIIISLSLQMVILLITLNLTNTN